MTKPVKIEQHSGLGLFWFAGWLFSIGFLSMSFWKGVLALFIWPYFIGAAITAETAPPDAASVNAAADEAP